MCRYEDCVASQVSVLTTVEGITLVGDTYRECGEKIIVSSEHLRLRVYQAIPPVNVSESTACYYGYYVLQLPSCISCYTCHKLLLELSARVSHTMTLQISLFESFLTSINRAFFQI